MRVFILSVVFVHSAVVASAQQFDHCNALLEHGINNISTNNSARHATGYNYHKYCRTKASEMSESKVREANASIFGFGSGGAGSNTNSLRKEIDSWCDQNRSVSTESDKLFQETRVVSSAALAAWNSCQNAAKKFVKIALKNQAQHNEFLHFEVDSTSDGDIYMTSVLQRGYDCKVSERTAPQGVLNALETNVRESAGYENVIPGRQILITNANVQINCQRKAAVIESGATLNKLNYESGSVVVNTSGPSFSIDIPAVVDEYLVTPPYAVTAFNNIRCPQGWSEYKPAYGRFIRGIDKDSSRIDPAGLRTPGSIQSDSLKSHHHDVNGMLHIWDEPGGRDTTSGRGRTFAIKKTRTVDVGTMETRPKNVALLFCEKK